jgi:hypothetical protein
MVNVDRQSEMYTMADTKWYQLTGRTAILVSRNDRKDLTANQLEAIVSYSKEYLRPRLGGLILGFDDFLLASGDEELDDFYDEIPRGVKANRKEFHEKYLSGREFDRFFNKLKASKMEMENMGGGDKSWAWTVSPQPQPVIDPDTAIKDEEVVVKMEEIDINMEDVEEKVRKTTRDEEIVEGERSPKRQRVE